MQQSTPRFGRRRLGEARSYGQAVSGTGRVCRGTGQRTRPQREREGSRGPDFQVHPRGGRGSGRLRPRAGAAPSISATAALALLPRSPRIPTRDTIEMHNSAAGKVAVSCSPLPRLTSASIPLLAPEYLAPTSPGAPPRSLGPSVLFMGLLGPSKLSPPSSGLIMTSS